MYFSHVNLFIPLAITVKSVLLSPLWMGNGGVERLRYLLKTTKLFRANCREEKMCGPPSQEACFQNLGVTLYTLERMELFTSKIICFVLHRIHDSLMAPFKNLNI